MRKFSKKLSLYNIETGELKENVQPEHAYAIEDFYDAETEKEFNTKIESQFAGLLSKRILQCDKEISLNRKELLLTRKFLLISIVRSIRGEEWMNKEKSFYERCHIPVPFQEKRIDGETSNEYWLRTIKVILDTDGTPQQIAEHPEKTYPAFRWASIIYSGYLSFWDAPNCDDEFVITDIGMTSENEKGWDGIQIHNHKKADEIKIWMKAATHPNEKEIFDELFRAVCHFSENFMMFPISAKRMIVLISPFFKHRYWMVKNGIPVTRLSELTVIPNEALFEPNRNSYVLPSIPGKGYRYHEDDRYIYDVKTLTAEEIQYCNALFMDRIDTYLGFSSLDKAVGSILKYKKLNAPPYTPRVDYAKLYQIINERNQYRTE